MSVDRCRKLALPQIRDERGNLSFVEGDRHIPFAIRRVYYLYDVPTDAGRGAHGHRELEQLIIPLAGSFQVRLDDGTSETIFTMDDPATGLYVCPMMWRDLCHFSPGAVALVLASIPYDEADYFRSYQEFREAALAR